MSYLKVVNIGEPLNEYRNYGTFHELVSVAFHRDEKGYHGTILLYLAVGVSHLVSICV